jgi:hypothetical protein
MKTFAKFTANAVGTGWPGAQFFRRKFLAILRIMPNSFEFSIGAVWAPAKSLVEIPPYILILVKSHLLMARPVFSKLPVLALAGTCFVFSAAGSMAADSPAAGQSGACFSAHGDLATGEATVTLSGGTLQRAGQVGEVFVPLHVISKKLSDYGATNERGEFFLFEDIFRSLDREWAGFTFTITALPETPAVVVLSALMAVIFFWPVRRRFIKDMKSIVGLRPPGRVRIEAYRRCANDDRQPREEVWADVPVVRRNVPATPAAKTRDRCYEDDDITAGEPLLSA